MGKETEVATVQHTAPTVAEATRDSTPPIRASEGAVLVNNMEYPLLTSKLPRSEGQEFSEHNLPLHGGKDTTVLAEQEQHEGMGSIAFGNETVAIRSTENLPNNVADHEAISRKVKARVRLAKEKQLEEMQGDLQDPKLMDILARLLSHPKREKIYLDPQAIEVVSERGRQCGGGGGGSSSGTSQGSQTESSNASSQSGGAGFGHSSLVVGGFSSGGGGGLGGSGDDDPNDRRPFNQIPSHYTDPVVFEEQRVTDEDQQLRHVMSTLLEATGDVMINDPLFPQFTKQYEEPLSASLDSMRPGCIPECMDLDIDSLCDPANDFYLPAEAVSAVEPAEETTLASYLPLQPSNDQESTEMSAVDLTQSPQILFEPVQPQSTQPSQPVVVPSQAPLPISGALPTQQAMVMQSMVMQPPQPQASDFMPTEESSDIKESFDIIHLMNPSTTKRPSLGGHVLSFSANVLRYPGVTPTTPHPPSPAPSSHSNMAVSPIPHPFTPVNYAPLPSPLPLPSTPTSLAPLLSPRPPSTPGTPAAATPCTPASSRSFGPFIMDTSTKGGKRTVELSTSQELAPERRSMAVKAMFFINMFYSSIYRCAEQEVDLKVASDVHAKMCEFEFDDYPTLTVTFSMPRQCKPLHQWAKQNTDLKDRLLVLQQVLNTVATIHTRGHEDNLTLWGSFMVWVASDLRVYLLVDFPVLLRKQEEVAQRGEHRLDPRMLDVMAVSEIYSNLVPPCIGKGDSWSSPTLKSALASFERCLGSPGSSCRMAEAARILGEKRVCKVEVSVCYLPVVFYCLEREELQTALRDLTQIAPAGISQVWAVKSATGWMRVGDIVTADRRMQLCLVPCMHPKDSRLLYIHCQPQSTN